jgi:hypothetical protein
MNDTLVELSIVIAASILLIGSLTAVLTLAPRLRTSGDGRTLSDAIARAPLLDLILALLTWIPWMIGCLHAGWTGLLGVLIGQAIVLQTWVFAHDLLHRRAVRGPRIVKFINGRFGRWRNHLALWVTLIALPGFWLTRLLQVIAYPWLIWLLGMPRYRHGEWISVSRHKFEGLVGHDLVWCLYCDWMTGVYALGGEMLRNVESFWCPIRFYEGKKCENCKLHFPDIDGGWVAADGSMQDVVNVMERMYPPDRKPTAWFGHPTRLTAEGEAVERKG